MARARLLHAKVTAKERDVMLERASMKQVVGVAQRQKQPGVTPRSFNCEMNMRVVGCSRSQDNRIGGRPIVSG
jgi:hypothetical protein